MRGLITLLAHLVFCFLFLSVSDGRRIDWFGVAVEQSLLTLEVRFGSLAGDLRFLRLLVCFVVLDLICGAFPFLRS